jgi:hypothetical protein
MSEFQHPKIHVTEIVEEDGELYEQTVTSPICDFCADTRARWEFECERFVIEEPIEFASDGPFCACDECARLVDARLGADLSARVVRSWGAAGVPKSWILSATDAAGLIVQAFFDHYTPGRKAFG